MRSLSVSGEMVLVSDGVWCPSFRDGAFEVDAEYGTSGRVTISTDCRMAKSKL